MTGLDPRGIYEIDRATVAEELGRAPGTGPVLVHLLDGFVDAGGVGRRVREHLLEHGGRRVATFDVDQLLDYRSKRSTMTFDASRWADYDEPVLAIDLLHDAEGSPFLVLHGAEPDLQWERFVAAVTQVVDELRVSLVATVHGIPMAVPHTRAATATVHGTSDALVGAAPAWFGRAEVPASASALLEYRLGRSGHDAIGHAVHVPHYAAQTPYAPGAMHGLTLLEGATGLDLWSGEVSEESQEALAEVARQVAGSDELTALVEGLERQYDAFAQSEARSLLAQEERLPSADELGAELERFLAQQHGGE
ncbi:proteasome assembly chaperone family protein [Luteimicrobium subarcticum]|nr:PAC2 family protein [Luteimicrobium subarcticum]